MKRSIQTVARNVTSEWLAAESQMLRTRSDDNESDHHRDHRADADHTKKHKQHQQRLPCEAKCDCHGHLQR
jgi:hypothetical protein